MSNEGRFYQSDFTHQLSIDKEELKYMTIDHCKDN